jgi:tetrathionate reductase subunit A
MWPGVDTTYSVCKQCHSDCGIEAHVFGGVLEKLDGNPYHPNATEPHAPYSLDPAVVALWPAPHSLCPRGQAGRQTVYDPYRITVPLKRTGPRGSGQWEAISWSMLIKEVTEGGHLFAHVKGEEHRHVSGFRELWDGGQARFRSIDPANPDFGPETNGLVIYWGRAEAGQADFLTRFGHAFGTINVFPHVGICDLNHHVATQESLNGMGGVAMLKPDIPNAEYILWFGENVTEANFPMQTLGRKLVAATTDNHLKYVMIDVRTGNGNLHANRWVPIAPGGDGALAMGMIRWIIDQDRYNGEYLARPNAHAAQAAGEPNFSNATWLVITDPGHPHDGAFLEAAEAGLVPTSASTAKEPVVVDPGSGQVMPASQTQAAALWPQHGKSGSIKVNGIVCQTAMQRLYTETSRNTVDEYAKLAGVSAAVIVSLAHEFTSHGRKAVADFYRGVSQHTNGVLAGRAIMVLNFLLGNVDWTGGYIMGGGAGDYLGKTPGAPYPLDTWPNQPAHIPSGVPISREGAFYEKSLAYQAAQKEGRSPFPAPRPWFPFGFGIWPEIFAGIYQQYPYGAKIVLQHMANPAWSPPAIGGANDPDLSWMTLIRDTNKVPLYIVTDIVMAESSSYADYIVPDLTYLEGWGFPPGYPTYPTKAQGVRHPVVAPLTGKTPSGSPMCMEQFIIDVASRVGLPGFGDHAFIGGGSLKTPEDFYLKMVANIAYDPGFLAVGSNGIASAGAVPNGSGSDQATIVSLKHSHPDALQPEEWAKAAYVLARGGRFEDYIVGYVPNPQTVNRLKSLTVGQVLETGVENWAQAPHQLRPSNVRQLFAAQLAKLENLPAGPPWVTHRYGALGIPCQIYNAVVATTHNAITGTRFPGTPGYIPPQTMDGRVLTQLDPPSQFPFVLSTHKQPIHSKSRTIADPWLLELMPEAFIDMSSVDASKMGIKSGDRVRVISHTYASGMIGRVRVLPGIRPGVITFPAAFGHWQYGSGSWTINGQTYHGDPARNAPVRLNAVMRLDPSLAAPDGWTIGLEDPIGGGAVYYETRVNIEKV